MGIEFEVKYAATEQIQQAIRQAFPGDYVTMRMETTYYDTPDFSLSDRHVTLRRRLENGEAVCTVKTPVAGIGRGEWECRCPDIGDGIIELCKLGAPRELLFLTADGVMPICGASFTRLAVTIPYEDALLELALDSGILMGGGEQIPLCEVEVELKSGTPEQAVDFACRLAERFGLEQEKRSKFRRALALAKGG